jgi:hypothetical protein
MLLQRLSQFVYLAKAVYPFKVFCNVMQLAIGGLYAKKIVTPMMMP